MKKISQKTQSCSINQIGISSAIKTFTTYGKCLLQSYRFNRLTHFSLIIFFLGIFLTRLEAQSYSVGYKKYTMGDFNGAIKSLKTSLRRTKNPSEKSKIYKIIGMSQYMLGKKKLAKKYFMSALSQNPNISISKNEVFDAKIISFFNSIKRSYARLPKTRKTTPQVSRTQSAVPTTKKAKSTTMLIESNAPNADVLVDGIIVGSTFNPIEVSPGVLSITLKANSFKTKKFRVRIKANTLNRLKLNLKKATPKPNRKIAKRTRVPKKTKKTSKSSMFSDEEPVYKKRRPKVKKRPLKKPSPQPPLPLRQNSVGTAQTPQPQHPQPQYSRPQYSQPQYSRPQYSRPQYPQPTYPPSYSQPTPIQPMPTPYGQQYPGSSPHYYPNQRPAPYPPTYQQQPQPSPHYTPPQIPQPKPAREYVPPPPPKPDYYSKRKKKSKKKKRKRVTIKSEDRILRTIPFGFGQFLNRNYMLGLVFGGTQIYTLYVYYDKNAHADKIQKDAQKFNNDPERDLTEKQDYTSQAQKIIRKDEKDAQYALYGFIGLWLIGAIEANLNTPKKKKKGLFSSHINNNQILSGHGESESISKYYLYDNADFDPDPVNFEFAIIPEPERINLILSVQYAI